MKEYPEIFVVCAAMRNKDGLIICGARHYDTVMREQVKALGGYEKWMESGPIEQGFIDQRGNFLTREEAYIIAKKNGQIVQKSGSVHIPELYSEDLY